MEEHRKNLTCASRHARMDPLGFGLPNARSFSGPGELKQIVLQQRAAFTAGLTEKMLTYALGRGGRYDRPVIS
jgi:hypothetical protein